MADETNSPRAPSTGVTVENMQDYLGVDGDEQILQDLITYSEEATRNAIDSTVDLDTYRSFATFNQAIRTLVDFNYYNRGALSGQQIAFPKSYQLMLNSFRFKVGQTNG